jgi:hypothetical protein
VHGNEWHGIFSKRIKPNGFEVPTGNSVTDPLNAPRYQVMIPFLQETDMRKSTFTEEQIIKGLKDHCRRARFLERFGSYLH